jgi:hypothetical protein
MDELDLIGLDEDNRLYWNGKPIVTEERITLAWWVNVSAVLTGASTFTLAVIELLRFLGLGNS